MEEQYRRKLCYHCSKPGTLKCSGCKGLLFCSRECQVKTWKSHKAICKSLSTSTTNDPNNTADLGSVDSTTTASCCLILDGMGSLGPGSFYVTKLKASLERIGLQYVVVDVMKGSKVPQQIGSILSRDPRFTSCIALGWGSGGTNIELEFGRSKPFQRDVTAWVKNNGGRFIVQGENPTRYGNWPSWFEKSTWKTGEYRRTNHVCNAKNENGVHWCSKWYHSAPGAIVTDNSYNVKAVMLNGVDPSDALFATGSGSKSHSLVSFMAGQDIEEGMCAVAVGKYGEGSVSYFGDVNAEDDTCSIMAIIARGGVTT